MKRNGFTLIELIITITIFSIVIVTVYSSFYMGIRAWRRGEGDNSLQEIRVGLLKMEKEVKDSFFFSKIPFTGTSQEVSFPLNVSEEDAEKIYIITYKVEEDEQTGLKQLIRKEKIFSAQSLDIAEKARRLLPLMKDIKFEYAYKVSNSSKAFEWQGVWDGGVQNSLPSGVRISLEKDNAGELYNKVIFIQHGRLGAR